MKKKINVDIILPSYDSYKYVETTIKSIIKQSFKNWRLIIVDSSSNIKTLKVLKKFKKNKKIKIFSFKKRLTAAQSRNFALKKGSRSRKRQVEKILQVSGKVRKGQEWGTTDQAVCHVLRRWELSGHREHFPPLLTPIRLHSAELQPKDRFKLTSICTSTCLFIPGLQGTAPGAGTPTLSRAGGCFSTFFMGFLVRF